MQRFDTKRPQKDHETVVENVVIQPRFSSPIPPYTGIGVVYPKE